MHEVLLPNVKESQDFSKYFDFQLFITFHIDHVANTLTNLIYLNQRSEQLTAADTGVTSHLTPCLSIHKAIHYKLFDNK